MPLTGWEAHTLGGGTVAARMVNSIMTKKWSSCTWGCSSCKLTALMMTRWSMFLCMVQRLLPYININLKVFATVTTCTLCSPCCIKLCGYYAMLHDEKIISQNLLQVRDGWAQHIMSLLQWWWWALCHLSKKLCIHLRCKLLEEALSTDASRSSYNSTVQHLNSGSSVYLRMYHKLQNLWSVVIQ